MVPLSDTRFQIDWDRPEHLEFFRDEAGVVTHFLHHWGGFEVDRADRRR